MLIVTVHLGELVTEITRDERLFDGVRLLMETYNVDGALILRMARASHLDPPEFVQVVERQIEEIVASNPTNSPAWAGIAWSEQAKRFVLSEPFEKLDPTGAPWTWNTVARSLTKLSERHSMVETRHEVEGGYEPGLLDDKGNPIT